MNIDYRIGGPDDPRAKERQEKEGILDILRNGSPDSLLIRNT
jgi:hypothetical protein